MEENPIIDLQTLRSFALVTEKKIDRKTLPADIEKRLTMLKANVGRYNGMKVRTTQFFETIHKNDALIADEILTFLELPLPKKADYKAPIVEPIKPVEPVVVAPPKVEPIVVPDPPKAPVKSKEELEKEENDRLAKEKKDKDDAEAKAKKEKEDALEKEKNDKVVAIDTAIKEKMQQYTTKDTISIADLRSIIGNVDLGTEITAGTLRLRKLYKQSFYKLR